MAIDYGLVSTRVGAIRLFFGSLISSFSPSLASRLVPATLPVKLLGVSGGVVTGTPVTLPEFMAAIPGTLPTISGGLLTTPVGIVEDWVATEDVEFDLAGEFGRCEMKGVDVGGDGAVKKLTELRWGC